MDISRLNSKILVKMDYVLQNAIEEMYPEDPFECIFVLRNKSPKSIRRIDFDSIIAYRRALIIASRKENQIDMPTKDLEQRGLFVIKDGPEYIVSGSAAEIVRAIHLTDVEKAKFNNQTIIFAVQKIGAKQGLRIDSQIDLKDDTPTIISKLKSLKLNLQHQSTYYSNQSVARDIQRLETALQE